MPIIGIDLGTTNSLCAYFAEDGPAIIPNSFGEQLTPSVVSVGEDGEIYTGKIARERLLTAPDMSASVFKRNMGTKHEYKLGDKTFLPEELSSIIIRKLKEDAETFLGEEVTEAVISVPAYFSDAQRRATKTAGELAGLKIERLVSEPTAAAIAYGLHEKEKSSKYLIFDLGGGTFDVSILEYSGKIMEVRAVAGDNYLGGEDFTDVLAKIFAGKNDMDTDAMSRAETALLIKSAEDAKKAFSSSREVTMRYTANGRDELTMDISLDEFERQLDIVLARLKSPVVRAMSDASVRLEDVNAVVLVGGATKLPTVRSFVGKLFGRLPLAAISPDEAVALGAAVYAAMKERNEAISELILTDVCPYTLGTNVTVTGANGLYKTGQFLPIIERNTTIPASRVERLYTLHDNQKQVDVDILQGENRLAKDNIFLGLLEIPIPPGTAGSEAVDVRYTYDINGILEVEVTTVSTGAVKKMVIEKNPGTMSKEEIAASLADLETLKIHPREKDEYKYLLEKGERLYREQIGELRTRTAQELSKFEDALDKQDRNLIDAAALELREYFEMTENIYE